MQFIWSQLISSVSLGTVKTEDLSAATCSNSELSAPVSTGEHDKASALEFFLPVRYRISRFSSEITAAHMLCFLHCFQWCMVGKHHAVMTEQVGPECFVAHTMPAGFMSVLPYRSFNLVKASWQALDHMWDTSFLIRWYKSWVTLGNLEWIIVNTQRCLETPLWLSHWLEPDSPSQLGLCLD